MALTTKKVERATDKGRYGDGNGLYLEVRSPKNRQWLFRYERAKRDEKGNALLKANGRPLAKEFWLNLGPAHTYDLEEARELARDMRKVLRNGGDPAGDRAQQRASAVVVTARQMSFREAADGFFASHSLKWKNRKHREQFTATMETYVFPQLGDLPVQSIDTPLVLSILNQAVDGKRFWLARPETATRVRRRIEWVLAWATVSQFRSGDNPARWRGHLDHVLPARVDVSKTRNHPALPYSRLPAFLATLRERESIGARALEFCILTAARTGEVIGARWDEIDLAAKVWSVPAERMKAGKHKNGQPHRVCGMARRTLTQLEPRSCAPSLP